MSNQENGKRALGLVGKKCGMTRIFTEDGASLPVTVIEVEPNHITQIRTEEADGYSAVQVTTGARKLLVSQARSWSLSLKRKLKPVVVCGNSVWTAAAELKAGDVLTVELFELVRRSMLPVVPRVRASRAALSVGTSTLRTLLTVTLCPTVLLVPSVSARLQVESSKARRWPVTWATLR